MAQSQKLPPGGASGYAPGSRIAVTLSNASMGLMSRWPVRLLLAKQFSKAGDIDLPDYEATGAAGATEAARAAGAAGAAGAGSGRGGGRGDRLAGDRLQ